MFNLPKPPTLQDLKYDIPSGLVVFLVALPLCLGIALASGAPLISGLVAGVVGGIIISILSGSEVSVSGPAAGLTVIVLSGIQQLGSFETFLLAVMLSGGFQILFSLIRLGFIADYVPTSVIQGMLAAIGIVIILKQIPHALGRDHDYEGNFSFWGITPESNTFNDIITSVLFFSPGALIITLSCLFVLIFWKPILSKVSSRVAAIPPSLIAILLGSGLNQFFITYIPSLALLGEDGHLVDVGMGSGPILDTLQRPNFLALDNSDVWLVGLTIAIVGSIESLLSIEAADKLDKHHRISNPNRELFAQGVGNIISGFLGGLPATSVVIRTSANIYSGSRTRWSSFLHGIFLLSAVLYIPNLLSMIPLAALAAVLLVIGYRLASVQLFKRIWNSGLFQFIPFITTILAVVFSDLLTGVLLGLAVGLFFVLRESHLSAFTLVNQDTHYLIRFNKNVSFLNKSELKKTLALVPESSYLILDGTRAASIEHDIVDCLRDFMKTAEFKSITLEYRNIDV